MHNDEESRSSVAKRIPWNKGKLTGAKPGSPWQNCFAERLIGSIRRECIDHVVALGEQHLRQVLKSYANYYNTARTHRSLDKDASQRMIVSGRTIAIAPRTEGNQR